MTKASNFFCRTLLAGGPKASSGRWLADMAGGADVLLE
jgi:hypothetical protein